MAKLTDEEISEIIKSDMPTEEENEAMWAEFSRLEAIENAKLDAIKLRVKELRGKKVSRPVFKMDRYFPRVWRMSRLANWQQQTFKPDTQAAH